MGPRPPVPPTNKDQPMMTLRERNKMMKDALDYENPNVELSTDRKKKTTMERGGK